MSKKLKVFRLSLKKWLRGNSENMERTERGGVLRDNTSELRVRRFGYECCLGMFAEQACGISARRLTGNGTPSELHLQRVPAPFAALLNEDGKDSMLAELAMSINDDGKTSDAQKIKALRPIFRKLGYRIEVVP